MPVGLNVCMRACVCVCVDNETSNVCMYRSFTLMICASKLVSWVEWRDQRGSSYTDSTPLDDADVNPLRLLVLVVAPTNRLYKLL